MTAHGHTRGHRIEYDGDVWRYAGTGAVADHERPCALCQQMPTAEGYDACLGELPGVRSACCGHGVEEGYIVMDQEIIGTELFHRTMEWADSQVDDLLERGTLMRKVWESTPWMVDVYTGDVYDGREHKIMSWCRDKFGPEHWPIHGKPGTWHRGGATIHGWTWMGFATKEMMDEFVQQWGDVPKEETAVE